MTNSLLGSALVLSCAQCHKGTPSVASLWYDTLCTIIYCLIYTSSSTFCNNWRYCTKYTIIHRQLQTRKVQYPNNPHKTTARISSPSFIQVLMWQLTVSSLCRGISSKLNFQESISTHGSCTHNLLHHRQEPY